MSSEQAGLPASNGGQKQAYKDKETLRHLYHDRDLEQSEMAEQLDTTAATISRWMKKLGVDTAYTKHDETIVEERQDFSGEEKQDCIYHLACGNEVPGGNNLICDKCLALARKRSRDGLNCPLDGVGEGDLLDHMELLHKEAAT